MSITKHTIFFLGFQAIGEQLNYLTNEQYVGAEKERLLFIVHLTRNKERHWDLGEGGP